ncbi:MAG: DNA alkylation repair protein [Bacteroidota bacterium]|nr:DNA alkylation repair protein [Bacteroidota bacterium]
MTSKELIVDIRAYCEAHADEAMVKKYSRYFKGEYNAYGLTQQLLEDKVRQLQEEKGVTLALMLEAAPELIAAPKYEEASFVFRTLDVNKKQYNREVFDRIATWYGVGIRNWAHADVLGMMILPVFLEKGIVEPEDFSPWLSAANPFQRRSVPVTFIKHIKKHREAIEPFFTFLEKLMSDPIREVHQGIGWYLREAWKLAPEPTEAFLLEWKETAARLIFQYACEKMTKEKKELFRRSKK